MTIVVEVSWCPRRLADGREKPGGGTPRRRTPPRRPSRYAGRQRASRRAPRSPIAREWATRAPSAATSASPRGPVPFAVIRRAPSASKAIVELEAVGGRGVGEAIEPLDGDGGAVEGVVEAELEELALAARCDRDRRARARRAPGCSLTSAKVGLATCRSGGTPAPRARPWTNVVFPAPSGPTSATTSPARSARPRRSPRACMPSAVSARTTSEGSRRLELDLLEVDEIGERLEALADLRRGRAA